MPILSAKPVDSTSFLKVIIATNAPTCIVHPHNNEPPTLKAEKKITTQRNNNENDLSTSPTYHQPPWHQGEQADWHNPVNVLDENYNIDSKENLTILLLHFAYCQKFVQVFRQFASMWHGRIDSIKMVQHKVHLVLTAVQPIHSPPSRARLKAIRFKKQEIAGFSAWMLSDSPKRSEPHQLCLSGRKTLQAASAWILGNRT